jgi:4'-phosphopantetheinyl transferase EntD
MAHSHTLLAPGAKPVIGRMFEASAAREPAPGLAAADAQAGGLPFVGTVLDWRPGASITVARRLALDHDMFLADHNFVHAPGIKPLADCFPVLPMTASLEVMAETAAFLAPGCGLVGFEAVTARRWIAVEHGGSLDLRIEGRLLDPGAQAARRRVAVQVFTGDEQTAAIDATVWFGSHHDATPAGRLQPVTGGTQQDATALYGERRLFHGPRFQRLAGPVRVGPDGASAEIVARGAGDWFAASPHPQLLTDPALLDTVGQLAALWSMQHGHAAFPIGIGRLDLYGPTPAPGMRLPVRLCITGQQLKMLVADVEIGDGEGGLWVRITDWKSWQFHWAAQLVEFQRQPARTLLSGEQALPASAASLACRRLDQRTLAGFDLALLARHYLHASEWQAFTAKSMLPARQRDWLLGRIVAKDAARAWCTRPELHPAAFAVTNDAAGQPRLAYWPTECPMPFISIAHAGGQAVALASDTPVGIDIEQVRPRDEHCVASFTTPAERLLLGAVADAARDAWVTRLWCAKEALGKRLGTGVTGGPQQFEAGALAADFGLPMRHAASGVEALVHTMLDGEFIIAFDIAAACR